MLFPKNLTSKLDSAAQQLGIVGVGFFVNWRATQLLSNGIIWGTLATLLGSCNYSLGGITISSGPKDGYYYRLTKHLNTSTTTTVKFPVDNLASEGSQENLQRLLDRQADFAIVQLDVAMEAMQQEKVKAVAVLAREYVHVITRKDSELKTFTDLQGKRVAVGTPGSGIRYTAEHLLAADNLKVQKDASNFDTAFQKLLSRQIDAVIYVGSPGASKKLQQIFLDNSNLKLLPLDNALINHLTAFAPVSYQSATLAIGTYRSRPPLPAQQIPTLSTATILVTRPKINRQKVALMTWSILSTARTYAQFYPELQSGAATDLLRRGIFYIHPAAQDVFEQGDPRVALIRYWENNNDLQAAVFIFITTSVVGLVWRQWHRRRSKKILTTTNSRICELKSLLPEHPQEALARLDALSQEHRLMFIEGAMRTEVYEQLQHKIQTFADQCRTLLEQQRKKFIMETLLLLDEWQAKLQADPEAALQKLSQLKQHYREMLLSDQVDIEAYIELVELTLLSLMTLAPKSTHIKTNIMSSGVEAKLKSGDALETIIDTCYTTNHVDKPSEKKANGSADGRTVSSNHTPRVDNTGNS